MYHNQGNNFYLALSTSYKHYTFETFRPFQQPSSVDINFFFSFLFVITFLPRIKLCTFIKTLSTHSNVPPQFKLPLFSTSSRSDFNFSSISVSFFSVEFHEISNLTSWESVRERSLNNSVSADRVVNSLESLRYAET